MGYKKLTVTELIKQKKALGVNQEKELYIDRLDGTITIKKPDIDLIMEVTNEEDSVKASKYLVYSCVTEPNLKEEVLQKEFGCVEPYDIVYKIFSLGEVNRIAEELFEMSGMNDDVKVIDNLKK